MRFALAWTFLSLSLALAAPLGPLEGAPGEAVTLVLEGGGEPVLPPGFALLLPPEPLGEGVVLTFRVPNLPPGEYPLRLGERVYPFRVKPLARAHLELLEAPELALGEVGAVRLRALNLGNLPLSLPPEALGVGLLVVRAEPQGVLAPGEERTLLLWVRGGGQDGQVLVRLGGASLAVRVPAKPAPPPPFHDWAKLPSRLLWTSGQGFALAGEGPLLDGEGRRLGYLAYRLDPRSASLAYDDPLFGLGVSLGPALGVSLRYLLQEGLNLTAGASTSGKLQAGLSYAGQGFRLAGSLGYPWHYRLEGSLLGGGAGERFALLGQLVPGYWALSGAYGQGPWNLQGGLGAGGGYLQGALALGGGVGAGLGVRFASEPALTAYLGVPVLGTVEVRGDFGLNSRRLRLSLFHVLGSGEERLAERLFWDGDALRYGLEARTFLPTEAGPLGLEGSLDLEPQGLGLTFGASLAPLSLRASLGFAGGGLQRFGLAGALAFDLPLYPFSWPTLGVRVEGAEASHLALSGPSGPFLLPLSGGAGALRLPPGVYRLRAPEGLGFLQGDRVVKEVEVELREDKTLALKALPALSVALSLRYCPPTPGPGETFGIPGVDPDRLLRGVQVRLRGEAATLLLQNGEGGLLPPGRYRLGIEGPYAQGARLASPEGGPLEEVDLRAPGPLVLCLTFPLRPLEEQDLP
ncbi:hypothetical protein [Thermus sp.]|uniref:hypothetical protein n=1 Tax=Thermus sp. TaxID=275 RepID=UPI003D1465D6